MYAAASCCCQHGALDQYQNKKRCALAVDLAIVVATLALGILSLVHHSGSAFGLGPLDAAGTGAAYTLIGMGAVISVLDLVAFLAQRYRSPARQLVNAVQQKNEGTIKTLLRLPSAFNFTDWQQDYEQWLGGQDLGHANASTDATARALYLLMDAANHEDSMAPLAGPVNPSHPNESEMVTPGQAMMDHHRYIEAIGILASKVPAPIAMLAMHSAADLKSGRTREAIVQKLAKEIDPQYQDLKTKDTPLHVAVQAGCVEAVKILLEKGARHDVQNNLGYTPWHNAVQSGNIAYIDALSDDGKNTTGLNVQDKRFNTPLHLAARQGHAAIVEKLIQLGADLGYKDKDGNTVLHAAVFSNNSDTVKAVIKESARLGINLNRPNHAKWTPLRWAETSESSKSIEACVDISTQNLISGTTIDAVIAAEVMYHVVHLAPDQQRTLKDIEDIIQKVTEKVDPKYRYPEMQDTPLHIAAEAGCTKAMEILLKGGAECDAQNDDRDTPLHLAAEAGCVEAVKILLIWGAKRNTRDCRGHTPLDLATKAEDTACIEALRDDGNKASLDVKEEM